MRAEVIGLKIYSDASNEEILSEIGRRFKAARIAAQTTQKDIAAQTNLSLRTISNLETGKDVSFTTVIECLRAMGMLPSLDTLIPEPGIRPSQIVQYGKMRERASRKNAHPVTGWKWGDEK